MASHEIADGSIRADSTIPVAPDIAEITGRTLSVSVAILPSYSLPILREADQVHIVAATGLTLAIRLAGLAHELGARADAAIPVASDIAEVTRCTLSVSAAVLPSYSLPILREADQVSIVTSARLTLRISRAELPHEPPSIADTRVPADRNIAEITGRALHVGVAVLPS
jgi:hypothetical protein